MKRLLMVGMVLAGLAFAGCQRMPSGIQDALYTAQITLEVTARDANAAIVYPYAPKVAGETDVQKAERQAVAVDLLVRTIAQANENLVQIVRWSRREDGDLKNE